MKIASQQENTFSPKYYGEKNEQKFDSKFIAVNNGYDIELDEIIIFDGGDVYGYEKKN